MPIWQWILIVIASSVGYILIARMTYTLINSIGGFSSPGLAVIWPAWWLFVICITAFNLGKKAGAWIWGIILKVFKFLFTIADWLGYQLAKLIEKVP